MKKMKLELDDLKAESFATAGGAGAPGTVRGNEDTDPSCFESCFLQVTCENWTCGFSCDPDGLETEQIDCYATQGSGCSFQSPHQSMCDFSCEFECPLTLQGYNC